MRAQELNAQVVDHGSSAGAQAALNQLAAFRVGPMTGRRIDQGRILVFLREGEVRKSLCGCSNDECRVAELLQVYEELLCSPGNADEQLWLAYWAYRTAFDLCFTGKAQGLHIPSPEALAQQAAADVDFGRRLDATDRAAEWRADDY